MPHPKPTDLDKTKHSDYFVWKDTSERVAQRYDYTVNKKRVNSCVLKHLFLEAVQQPKILPKNPGNALSNVLLMSRFQNFAADAAKKNHGFFETALCAVLNEFIRINSRPNILRSCILHCSILVWCQRWYDKVVCSWCDIYTQSWRNLRLRWCKLRW